MRALFLFVSVVTACAASSAQEQDPGLLLQTRNEGLAGKMFQNKSFYDGKVFQGGSTASVHDFYFPQRFDAKTFFAQDFRSNAYWRGDVRFATKEMATKKDTRDEKQVETKAAAVKDARESGKNYETRDYANAREFRGQGKSQKQLDAERHKKQMSSDEVRTLLNKNK